MWTARVNLRQSFFLLFRFLYFFLAFLGPRVVAHFVSSRAERKAPSPFQATVLDPWMPVVATKRGSPALSQRNSEKKTNNAAAESCIWQTKKQLFGLHRSGKRRPTKLVNDTAGTCGVGSSLSLFLSLSASGSRVAVGGAAIDRGRRN